MHCGTDCLSSPFYHFFTARIFLFVCFFFSFLLPSFLSFYSDCLCGLERNGTEPEKICEKEKENDEMKRNHLRRSLPLYCFHYVNKTRGHLSGNAELHSACNSEENKKRQLGTETNQSYHQPGKQISNYNRSAPLARPPVVCKRAYFQLFITL